MANIIKINGKDIKDVKATQDVADLKSRVNDIASVTVTEAYTDLPFTEQVGHVINDRGVIANVGNTYCISSPISVAPGNTYFITASADYYNSLYAWYTESDTFISARGAGGSGSTVISVTDDEAVAPANAAILRIAYKSPRTGEVKISNGYENVLLPRVEQAETDIATLNGRVDALDTSVADLDDRADTIETDIEELSERVDVLDPSSTVVVSLTKSGDDITITDIESGLSLQARLHGSNNRALNLIKYVNQDNTTYKIADDDIGPIYYDGSYRCGNHGNLIAIAITSSAHGLTEADIGKVLTSANDVNYVLVRIVDTNVFWVVNDSQSYTFSIAAPTSPFTIDGNTLAFTAAATKQLLPNTNNISQTLFVDGTIITNDGTYTGHSVEISETYYSIDCLDMLAKLKANVGSNTNASYYGDSIAADLIYATDYVFGKGLQMVVKSKIITRRSGINLTSWGVTQAQTIGHRCFAPDSDDTGVWTASALKSYTPSTWADADFPVYKLYQFNDNTTDGFVISYAIDYDDGKPAIRKTNCPGKSMQISSVYKIYPFIVSMNRDNVLSNGTVLSGIAIRQPINLSNTLSFIYELGGKLHIEIDNMVDDIATVLIPVGYNGKLIDIVHASANINVIDNAVINNTIRVIGKGSLSICL